LFQFLISVRFSIHPFPIGHCKLGSRK